MEMIIGIDPGKSGGVAVRVGNNEPETYDMPETPADMLALFRSIAEHPAQKTAFMEKVGGHRPGNSAIATATFNRHIGQLEMALLASSIPVKLVAPQTWMKKMGSLSKDKGTRKNQIKDLMQRRYPSLKITLKTSDALGIMTYGLES